MYTIEGFLRWWEYKKFNLILIFVYKKAFGILVLPGLGKYFPGSNTSYHILYPLR